MTSNHFDNQGQAIMVDVSAKAQTKRIAIASAKVKMSSETISKILEGRSTKGDVFAIARLAGICVAGDEVEVLLLDRAFEMRAAT